MRDWIFTFTFYHSMLNSEWGEIYYDCYPYHHIYLFRYISHLTMLLSLSLLKTFKGWTTFVFEQQYMDKVVVQSVWWVVVWSNNSKLDIQIHWSWSTGSRILYAFFQTVSSLLFFFVRLHRCLVKEATTSSTLPSNNFLKKQRFKKKSI